ncbi:hypothetical protein SpCBS45565_g00618 [Spizellomyces sp. 'palustris']|nr:hypothetical protein SpCBS45565_g00618 [Spizellomyces sp. 'palustris']
MLASTESHGKKESTTAYDLLYQAFGHNQETKRERIQISNPIPQHDILHENQRSRSNAGVSIASADQHSLKKADNSLLPSTSSIHSRAPRSTAKSQTASRKGSNDSITLATPFSARFGLAAVPHRSAKSYAVRRPTRSRPSLSSLPSLNDEFEDRTEYSVRTMFRRPPNPVQTFENIHKLAEIEFFFLGKPLVGTRIFLRDDVVYKVRIDGDERYIEPRRLFLLSDMLIYGTPLGQVATDHLANAYDRQTILLLADLEVMAVDDTDYALVDIETPTQSLRVGFDSNAKRDEWIAVARRAVAETHAWEARQRRRRHSNASQSSLSEWNLFKLWQGVDFASNKRGTVVDRKVSMSTVSSVESVVVPWIPDHEVYVQAILLTFGTQ